ncbi:MAG TPA: hypothetical protein PLD19_10395 [Luteimonas sp.]|nr:hypothetical protein [Luteimonas sp.]
MKIQSMKIQTLLAAVALCALSAGVSAQKAASQNVEKKLYCWNEDGRKVCGDALPAHAVDSARTELSVRSGRKLGELDEQLSDEERAAANEAARQAAIAANADAARQRRELAMVESYATEDDLRNAFGDRIVLVDEGLKTSHMSIANLRLSLASLLRQANDFELRELPVGKSLAGSIQSQHADLLRQQSIMQQQQEERASLDSELEYAVERYRAMKGPKRR